MMRRLLIGWVDVTTHTFLPLVYVRCLFQIGRLEEQLMQSHKIAQQSEQVSKAESQANL